MDYLASMTTFSQSMYPKVQIGAMHFLDILDSNQVLDGEGFSDKKLRLLKLKKYTY